MLIRIDNGQIDKTEDRSFQFLFLLLLVLPLLQQTLFLSYSYLKEVTRRTVVSFSFLFVSRASSLCFRSCKTKESLGTSYRDGERQTDRHSLCRIFMSPKRCNVSRRSVHTASQVGSWGAFLLCCSQTTPIVKILWRLTDCDKEDLHQDDDDERKSKERERERMHVHQRRISLDSYHPLRRRATDISLGSREAVLLLLFMPPQRRTACLNCTSYTLYT